MPFKRKLWVLNLSLFVIFVLFAVFSIRIGFVQVIEFKLMDIETNMLDRVHPVKDTSIVIVDIDDNSYQMLQKRFPWPRDYYARLVRNLKRAGAKEVIFDIEFDIPTSRENDSMFASEIAKTGNVTLAAKVSFYENEGITYKSLVEPIPILKKAAKSVGLVNIPYDPDGIVRHYFKYLVFSGDTIRSLAYSTYCNLGRGEKSPGADNLFYVIPPGPQGTFPTYSFWSVIDDSMFQIPETDVSFDVNAFYEYLKDNTFKNKIVFVGSSLMELHDYIPCYYQTINKNKGLISGVEYHASALLALLYHRQLMPLNRYFRILIMIMLGLIIIKSFDKRNIMVSSIVFAGLFIVIVFLSFFSFIQFHRNIYPVEMIILMTEFYLFNVIFLALELRKERIVIKRLFQYYVSKDVVNKLIHNPELVHLSGEMKVLTVLFTDIEGFTTISESLEPKLVTDILNEYLAIITDVIIKNGGMIDKYEGDAVMAVFGAPIELDNHAYSAVKSGLGIINAQSEIDRLTEKYGISKIKTRVGINTGEMLIGNLGTKNRLNYTVMGDSVNLASRLESINKVYKTYLLCSEYTKDGVNEKIKLRFIDKIIVKGKTKAISIYQPLALAPAFNEDLFEKYNMAVEFYHQRNFKDALNLFSDIFRKTNDYVSFIFSERCKKYMENPPGKDWTGVEKFLIK